MAHWASTSYRIEGSKNELERVFNVIDDFMTDKRKPVRENASKEWEGNIVRVLGATDEQMENNYLRGFIQEYEMNGDTICVEAEEAWGTTDFRHVLAQLIPELTIYYIVEEPGCEIYATNDSEGKYFIDRFYVDACINGNYESDYFEIEEQEGDDFIYVHEFEIEN